MIEAILQSLLQGTLIGSFYALVAVGLALIIMSVRIYSLAHAELVTIGAYVTGLLTIFYDVNIVIAILASTVISAILSVALDESIYKPLETGGATMIQTFVAAVGAGIVLRYILYICADSFLKLGVFKSSFDAQIVVELEYLAINTLHLVVIPAALFTILILHLILIKTSVGRQVRAISENLGLARVCGIRAFRVRRFVWLTAGGLAGMAGALWSMYSSVIPTTGWSLLIVAFAANIVGGLTNIYGTILGAYVLGIAENLGAFIFGMFMVPIAYKPLISFAIAALVMITRETLPKPPRLHMAALKDKVVKAVRWD